MCVLRHPVMRIGGCRFALTAPPRVRELPPPFQAVRQQRLRDFLTNPAQRVKRGQCILQNKTNFAPA